MKSLAIAAAAAVLSTSALADPLTVNQCMAVYAGLEALRYAGAQLGDARPAPPDAKQYKLGEIRGIAAFNMAKLQRVMDGFAKARSAVTAELAAERANVEGANFTVAATARLTDALQKVLDGPCNVQPDHFKLADLRLGDDADHNQIPNTVISALAPIIDR